MGDAMNAPVLSVIILTLNEESNLPFCLASLRGLEAKVFVVDSGSTDRTVSIARDYGATVVQHEFENYARQFNWALDTLPLSGEWTMRLDADERLMPELTDELRAALPAMPASVSALAVKRRVYFWGRWIRYGGYYPIWLVRVWRTGKARCEDSWMDEHTAVSEGEIREMRGDIIDENRKGLTFWIDKHNHYSDREVKWILAGAPCPSAGQIGQQAARKRFLKQTLYGRAPRVTRAVIYWLYRYFLRVGFLDGRAGFVFHFLQALWYRIVVDAKLYELEQKDHRRDAACGKLQPAKAEPPQER
jgi:glycosyltransferase involved in cell wall biosynthesis